MSRVSFIRNQLLYAGLQTNKFYPLVGVLVVVVVVVVVVLISMYLLIVGA